MGWVSEAWGRVVFQYPQSDRGRCNGAVASRWAGGRGRFQYPQSDRGRCNYLLARHFLRRFRFQYPQSDRGRCNSCFFFFFSGSGAKLSVSSVGSWALQPRLCSSTHSGIRVLSVSSVGSWALQLVIFAWMTYPVVLSVSSVGSWALQRVAVVYRNIDVGALSVSSVGSWALQLLSHRSVWLTGGFFQYPQSDRGRCNAAEDAGGTIVVDLSVSSVGSWALQPHSKLLMCSTNVLNYG